MNQFLRKYAMLTTNEGRMESMNQLLKKCALLAGCAALALCFTTRSAHAQAVAAGGTGEHLIFGYWSTDNYINTLVAINSPLGVRNRGEGMNVLHVVIRDAMGDPKAAFNTCLTPGDTWTAVLSEGNLMVGDAGGCDGLVAPPPPPSGRTPDAAMMATPASGEMVALGATSGYFEAWLNPDGTLADDTYPCTYTTSDGSQPTGTIIPADIPGAATTNSAGCAGLRVGDFDADALPEDAAPTNISGMAILVSPMAGFASSYNATALMGCGNADNIADDDAAIMAASDDGNACWAISPVDSADPVVDGSGDGAPIRTALMAQGKDLLTGRWSAIADENITSHTKVVLTLPVNHLNYEGTDADSEDVTGTDPVSVYVFDEAGGSITGTAMLGMNVNMCRFMTASAGDGMDMGDGEAMLSCNGEMVSGLPGMAGGFRIYNGVTDMQGDNDDTDDTEATFVRNDGAEIDDYGIGLASTDAENDRGGQVPAESLAVIGLNFSYFMGTDGNLYDQVTDVQWISISGTATDDTTGVPL